MGLQLWTAPHSARLAASQRLPKHGESLILRVQMENRKHTHILYIYIFMYVYIGIGNQNKER